jgi:maltose/moltooligosaccharide transporter
VLPQIFVSLGLGWVMQNLLCNNRLLAVVIGGAFLIVAALFMQRVQVVDSEENISEVDGSGEVESFT